MSDTAPRPRRRPPRKAVATDATTGVVSIAHQRIVRALAARERYRYVTPRVEPLDDGGRPGWRVVSPNCSRKVDAHGGEIDIAWFVQQPDGRWQLRAREHTLGRWRTTLDGATLQDALARVCEDPQREYWP